MDRAEPRKQELEDVVKGGLVNCYVCLGSQELQKSTNKCTHRIRVDVS